MVGVSHLVEASCLIQRCRERERESGYVLCLIVFLSEGKSQSSNDVFFVGERGVGRSWNLEDAIVCDVCACVLVIVRGSALGCVCVCV